MTVANHKMFGNQCVDSVSTFHHSMEDTFSLKLRCIAACLSYSVMSVDPQHPDGIVPGFVIYCDKFNTVFLRLWLVASPFSLP